MDQIPSSEPDRSATTTEPHGEPRGAQQSASPGTVRDGTSSPGERTQSDEPTGPVPGRYRWTCPLCGETRLVIDTGRTREAHVVNDLRSHVRAAAGGGHGASGTMPPGIDPVELGRHVRRLEQ